MNMVIADRQVRDIQHFPYVKKILQRWGSAALGQNWDEMEVLA